MYLKITFGILLSFICAIFPILFYAHINMEDHPPLSETTAVCAFSAAAFVFLGCLFTYGYRKKAALTALIICGFLIMQRLIGVFTAASVRLGSIIGLGCVFCAAAIGFFISYAIFKNNGWDAVNQPKTPNS